MSKLKIFSSLLVVVVLVIGIFVATNQTQTRKILSSFAATSSGTSDSTLNNGNPDSDIDGNGQVDLFDFNTVVSNFGRKFTTSPGTINVKAFGAKGDGVTDDTAAIQAAISAANQTGPGGRLGYKEIYFPYGDYVISSLNTTNLQSFRMRGETMLGTRLIPSKQTSSIPVIDASNSPYFAMENMSIWAQDPMQENSDFPVNPSVGILFSQSTKVNLSRVFVAGWWEKAGIYLYGSTNNTFQDISIHSYKNGVPALVMTGSNSIGGTSNYVTSPYFTLPAANPINYTSDLTCVQCEIHTLILKRKPPYDGDRFDKVSLPRLANTTNIIIENASNFKMYGGVISTDGPSEVNLRGKTANISFSNVVIESESGIAPKNTFEVAGPVDGLVLENNLLNNGMDSSGWLIYGTSGASIKSLNLTGAFSAELPQYGRLMKIEPHANPQEVVLSNSIIQAHGWNMEIGGSIRSTQIIEPGAVSVQAGATDGSTKIN
jgi:hypothetical protein